MLKLLLGKIKESAISVVPIVVIVCVLSFTPIYEMSTAEMIAFLLSSIMLILSMGVFNLGASLAMTPMGEYAGVGLLKKKNAFLLFFVTFAMGFLVTIAEPDLMVLAKQVKEAIDGTLLIVCVGLGVAMFMLFSIFKMLVHKQLSQILMISYMLIFAIVAILLEKNKSMFLPLAFDSGGVTTGPITVPFIMAYGFGIASTIGGRDSNENSFGMVALSSIGPILVVLLLSLFSTGNINYTTVIYDVDIMGISEYISKIYMVFKTNILEVGKAIVLMFVFFMILQFTILRLPKTKMIQIVLGVVITFFGLVMFLTSVTAGFLPIGQSIGLQLANLDERIVILFGLIIGMTVVLAEPAIQILIEQVEEVTVGAIRKSSMLISLSIGVGLAIALAFIRIFYGFSVLYYLVPGYFISLALSLFVPPIYTSIAFDSGGVASGPMASTFILPLVIGFCSVYLGDDKVLDYAFGVIALIAMIPLISIQLLGFKSVAAKFVRDRLNETKILGADDNQIVYFDLDYTL